MVMQNMCFIGTNKQPRIIVRIGAYTTPNIYIYIYIYIYCSLLDDLIPVARTLKHGTKR